MQRHPDYTRERVKQLADRIKDKIYSATAPVEQILVSPRVDRISYAEAQKLKFKPAKLGDQFGPLWATFWFKLKIKVPKDWAGKRVDLLWISWSEATLWIDGKSIQGLNWTTGERPDATIFQKAKGGDTIELQVEMACNQKFGQWHNKPFTTVSPFVLDKCEIAAFDPVVWELYWDLWVLQNLEAEMAKENSTADASWAGELLSELNRFANEFDLDDRATWKSSHAILKKLYQHHNASHVHELSAIGHAHIDTAWLWPLAETHRKCERTFSTQTALHGRIPRVQIRLLAGLSIRHHQAAQPRSLQPHQDENKIRPIHPRRRHVDRARLQHPLRRIALPPVPRRPDASSSKSSASSCKEFWNPDVFGYNGQLPQIMRLAGITRFLTQKLSWNRFNKPQHHTFTWQGIDGTEVLAHFPPADTYNAEANVPGAARQRQRLQRPRPRQPKLHALRLRRRRRGPNQAMIETLRRAKDLQGLPRTQMRTQ